ncbi:hypothetical protein CCR75_009430 [Bremia lactucae]|uniref:Uncharacterized protein n=1 Tax=Bremia lactucae TaxID=4779 RepID=A0A976NZL1_BRELC|nr:hypothetical protein CCR75_009430 [Bremia lactucae]
MYRPSTISRGGKVFETGQQVRLQLEECVAAVKLTKEEDEQRPLILRFWGEHYSASVHTRTPEQSAAAAEESTDAVADFLAPLGAEGLPHHQRELALVPNGMRVLTDPGRWDDNISELRHSLNGMSIPPDLMHDIRDILDRAQPARYAKLLLSFLVKSASQMSRDERDKLFKMDLSEACNQNPFRQLQLYGLSRASLLQWQSLVRRLGRPAPEVRRQQIREDSASACSTGDILLGSSEAHQLVCMPDPRPPEGTSIAQKRAHLITPADGEQIRRIMRTMLDRPPEGVEVMTDACPADSTGGLLDSRTAWLVLWQRHAAFWPVTAQVPLPLKRSSSEEWIRAAQQEPASLLSMVQQFPYPAEVLEILSTQVLEAWTTAARRGVLLVRLTAYCDRAPDNSTRKWLNG